MLQRRRCPFCRRWFHPHPRLKQRQKTCARPDCRRQHKRKSNQQWRIQHPDYFRGVYALQKEMYGTRADYKRLIASSILTMCGATTSSSGTGAAGRDGSL